MATSHGSSHTPDDRVPLRLAWATGGERRVLDGAWWPQSRHLPTELADLVDHVSPELARIVRVVFSPHDWGDAQRRITLEGRDVEAGPSPHDDTHVLILHTSDHTTLTLLVVPPGFTAAQGEEAMLAASTAGNQHSAGDLLAEVTEHPHTGRHDEWSDDGGTWWDDDTTPPSYR